MYIASKDISLWKQKLERVIIYLLIDLCIIINIYYIINLNIFSNYGFTMISSRYI